MKKTSSTESAKHPYLKRAHYLKPENRFWENNPLYSDKTKERLNALAESFYNRKHILND